MTAKESRHAELLALREKHNLTRAQIAELLGLKVVNHSHGSVNGWLSGRRTIPAATLELLKIKLEGRTGEGKK